MRTSEVVFRVVENDRCPFYAKGDEFKLSGNALLLELKQEKTFVSTAIVTPPFEKETCRTLIGDLTRILIEFESVDRVPEELLACSGCSGVIKLEPCLHHRANGTTGAKDRSRNIDAVAGILSNFSIFQALDHQNLRDIVALLKLKRFARNEVILKKGDPARNLYIILSGAVDVLDEDGVRLSALQKGDVFGEMGMIGGFERSASAYAVGETTCLATDASKIEDITGENRLAFNYVLYWIFAEILTERLKSTTDELVKVKKELAELKSGKNVPAA